MIFRVVPRHSSCCLVRPACFSFLWRGWLGCRCPAPAIQKYPQSSAWEAEGRFAAFSNAWYHDIRHSIMFLNIQHYIQRASKADHYMSFHCVLWCPLIFHDIPIWSMSFQDRQTMISWYSIDSFKLFDTPWYSNICGDLPTDWYCTIFVEIPWYSSTRSELLKQTLTSHHDIPRCSTTFLVLVGEASLFLIFVARVARVPMPPSGDTEISPK